VSEWVSLVTLVINIVDRTYRQEASSLPLIYKQQSSSSQTVSS